MEPWTAAVPSAAEKCVIGARPTCLHVSVVGSAADGIPPPGTFGDSKGNNQCLHPNTTIYINTGTHNLAS